MSLKIARTLAVLTGIGLTFTSANAADFVWQGGGSASILDAANWVGGTVPPNDGTNINLVTGDIIRFAPGADRTIPDDSGRQINVPAGAQISAVDDAARRHRVNARINIA